MKTAINELRTLDEILEELPQSLETEELRQCVQIGLERVAKGDLGLSYKIIRTIRTKAGQILSDRFR